MPVSVKIDPFSQQPILNNLTLRAPQARVLAPLQPEHPDDPVFDWPLITRAQLGVRAGYTAISGTVTRALNGIRAGSSSGDPHPGLLARGMVEEVVLYIEGTREVNYRVTRKGVEAYQAYITKQGGKLPELKDAATCTNDRYRKNIENI